MGTSSASGSSPVSTRAGSSTSPTPGSPAATRSGWRSAGPGPSAATSRAPGGPSSRSPRIWKDESQQEVADR
jgi:hypothetical protein